MGDAGISSTQPGPSFQPLSLKPALKHIRNMQRNHLEFWDKDSAMNINNPPAAPSSMPPERMQLTFHSSRSCERFHNFHDSPELHHGGPPRTAQVWGPTQSESESRIQELEDRVLVLEKTVATKDKEICRLKGENEELCKRQERSNVNRTGTKRARYGHDGMDEALDRIEEVLKDLR